ncbi:toll/interleukin-1 receptor domain-containing protein [Foetidibacter luteolus]|uniref:toll/interleukin-1 receptor domain-containing protein n=1 Tax=Foetidibacter luteolus TaxID=2608880 RepID=UPI001A999450|nr:toll/interleukin-1 receptor domain-containing protein [Foetidibacter luteolus]
MKNTKLFFSYNRKDSDFALKLANDLIDRDVNVWMDQLHIRAGERWDKSVEDALTSAEGLLVVLSPAAVASNNVLDEVSYAIESNKIIIPVIAITCNIPFRLKRFQYVDFTGDYNKALNKLMKELAPGNTTGPSAAEPKPEEATAKSTVNELYSAQPASVENSTGPFEETPDAAKPKSKRKLVIAALTLLLLPVIYLVFSGRQPSDQLATASIDSLNSLLPDTTALVDTQQAIVNHADQTQPQPDTLHSMPNTDSVTAAPVNEAADTSGASEPGDQKNNFRQFENFSEALSAMFTEAKNNFADIKGVPSNRMPGGYRAKITIKDHTAFAAGIFPNGNAWAIKFIAKGPDDHEEETYKTFNEIILNTFRTNSQKVKHGLVKNSASNRPPVYMYLSPEYRIEYTRALSDGFFRHEIIFYYTGKQ